MLGSYTPLDIDQVVGLMRTHPDMYVVTDTKYVDAPHVKQEFGLIVRAMGSDKAELGKRFIVQIYNESMLEPIRSVYPFPNVIYTIYQHNLLPAKSSRSVQFARANGIPVITLDMVHWSARLAAEIRAAGLASAINSINSPSEAAALNAAGVRFLYSDSLPARPWWAGTLAVLPVAPMAPTAMPFNPQDD